MCGGDGVARIGKGKDILCTYMSFSGLYRTAKKLPQASIRGVGWHAVSSDYSRILPDCGVTAKTKAANE